MIHHFIAHLIKHKKWYILVLTLLELVSITVLPLININSNYYSYKEGLFYRTIIKFSYSYEKVWLCLSFFVTGSLLLALFMQIISQNSVANGLFLFNIAWLIYSPIYCELRLTTGLHYFPSIGFYVILILTILHLILLDLVKHYNKQILIGALEDNVQNLKDQINSLKKEER